MMMMRMTGTGQALQTGAIRLTPPEWANGPAGRENSAHPLRGIRAQALGAPASNGQ
jgi:hypothetical protein